MAVGSTYQGEDNDAVVFTSADGVTWQRAAGPGGAFGGPGWQGMHAVTAGGPGWVAVGYAASEEDWAAAVWTSADGLTWARVPHDEALFGGENDQEMFGVIAAGPGLVAVGVDDDAPAVWLSADGLAWEKVAADRFSSDPAFGQLRQGDAGSGGVAAVRPGGRGLPGVVLGGERRRGHRRRRLGLPGRPQLGAGVRGRRHLRRALRPEDVGRHPGRAGVRRRRLGPRRRGRRRRGVDLVRRDHLEADSPTTPSSGAPASRRCTGWW